MKDDASTTPKTQEKDEKGKKVKSGFMADTAVRRFYDDIRDGDSKGFDVTTYNGFLKELITKINKVDVSGLASQLAFFFLLSLFPLLIFLFTLLPYLNLDQGEIFLFIRDYAPESVSTLLEDTLGDVFNKRNNGLLSFGIIATIWSASKGMNALTIALNRTYSQEETRSFIVARGMSVVFTVMLIAVLIVALVLPVFGQQIGTLIFSYLGLEEGFLKLWSGLRLFLPPVLIFSVFSLIYWLVPNLRLKYKSVILGSLFATVGWIITSLGFSFYVGNYGSYSNTYGSIGAIIVLMMWLYLSGIILIIGGQINAVMSNRKRAIEARKKSGVVESIS